MNPTALLALLGRSSSDPSVEATLRNYEVRNRPRPGLEEAGVEGPVIETQSWVKNSRAGIEFGFQDEASWFGLDETEFGKLSMLLTEIYFYGKHEGVGSYQEELPFGLRLSDDRATVRRKMTRFEQTRHSYLRDTWDTADFRITIAFADDDRCIRFALCMLREPALPRLPYSLAPVPSVSAIQRLLGRGIEDAGLRLAFDPLGLQARWDEIREEGEADFRRPYGVLLDFALPEAASSVATKGSRLVCVTFFADREQGARAWPGDLPYGLHFGDSPEMAIQKLGRPPDLQNDSEENFSGIAVWHEPGVCVHVYYDTMENQVLRVSLLARPLEGMVFSDCLGG